MVLVSYNTMGYLKSYPTAIFYAGTSHLSPQYSKVIQMEYPVSLSGAKTSFQFPEIRLDFLLYLNLLMKYVINSTLFDLFALRT